MKPNDACVVRCRSASLQVLDLSANAIERIPPLAEALPALAELILDENVLGILGDELLGLPKLKKLSAKSNRIAARDPATGEQVTMFLATEIMEARCFR